LRQAKAELRPALAGAKELIGHRTESEYQRYDIVAERDLADGVVRYAARLGK
jgi:hypothetical protein